MEDGTVRTVRDDDFDGRTAVALMGVLSAGTLITYAADHPYIVGACAFAVLLLGLLVWRQIRKASEPESDPGQHHHYDGIQTLKILALANNRIDQSDRDIVGAYMRTVPDNLLSIQVAETIVSADLPSPMDLDRHIDGARRSLEPAELRVLVEHVRMMRGAERRLTPVTREWFDRAEQRLLRPLSLMDPGRDALGLEDRSDGWMPLLDGAMAPSHVERFDAIVGPLRREEADVEVRRALSRLREPIETLDGVQTDDKAEDELDDILDRQLAGVVSSYLSVAALRETRALKDARAIVIRSADRLTETAEAIVSRLTGEALSRLNTVGRYVEAKNPAGIGCGS